MFNVHETTEVTSITRTGTASVQELYRAVRAELDERGSLTRTRGLLRRLGSDEPPYAMSTLALNIGGVLEDRDAPSTLDGWVAAVADEFDANQRAFMAAWRS